MAAEAPIVIRTGFIVELFGPAACGKTTLSRALERALAMQGIPVRIIASARPGEKRPKQTRAAAALTAPVSRTLKLFAALGALVPGVSADPLARNLLETLPPKGWVGPLRLRRYLRNLCCSWRTALMSQDVAIFDQGFMNSLCSLALLSGLVDRNSLERGLSLVPAPDLLIRVDTPRDVLKTRLERRLHRLSPIERLFERDVETSLRHFELSACLDEMLANRGRYSLHVNWRDDDGLVGVAAAAADHIIAMKKGAAI